jgi:hypothetical protein
MRWIRLYGLKEVKAASDGSLYRQSSILTSNVLTPIITPILSSSWLKTTNCSLENLYGMHIFSKLPLDEQEISHLVEKDVPSILASLVLLSETKFVCIVSSQTHLAQQKSWIGRARCRSDCGSKCCQPPVMAQCEDVSLCWYSIISDVKPCLSQLFEI